MSTFKSLSVATVGATFIGLGTIGTAQAAETKLGGQIYSTGTEDIQVEILGGSEGDFGHELFLSILESGADNIGETFTLEGSYPKNAELIFGIRVKETGLSYVTGPGSRNPDGLEHANVTFTDYDKATGIGTARVGFEDLFGDEGDKDYNDFKFQVSGGIKPTPAPEPSSALGTLIFGGLSAGCMLKRKLKRQDQLL